MGLGFFSKKKKNWTYRHPHNVKVQKGDWYENNRKRGKASASGNRQEIKLRNIYILPKNMKSFSIRGLKKKSHINHEI